MNNINTTEYKTKQKTQRNIKNTNIKISVQQCNPQDHGF